jgi:hypothetical protein
MTTLTDLAESQTGNRAKAVGAVGPVAVGGVVVVAPIPAPWALTSESHVADARRGHSPHGGASGRAEE